LEFFIADVACRLL